MTESDRKLHQELVKLAQSNPELRPHLLPLVRSKEGSFYNPLASSWMSKLALVLAQYCDGSITTVSDFQKAAAILLKTTLALKKDADLLSPAGDRMVSDLCAEYHSDLARKLKPVL